MISLSLAILALVPFCRRYGIRNKSREPIPSIHQHISGPLSTNSHHLNIPWALNPVVFVYFFCTTIHCVQLLATPATRHASSPLTATTYLLPLIAGTRQSVCAKPRYASASSLHYFYLPPLFALKRAPASIPLGQTSDPISVPHRVFVFFQARRRAGEAAGWMDGP